MLLTRLLSPHLFMEPASALIPKQTSLPEIICGPILLMLLIVKKSPTDIGNGILWPEFYDP